MQMKYFVTLILLCAASFMLAGAEFKLTEKGKAVSCIVLRKDATVVEKHAAKELSKYLGKISGGETPVIGNTPVKGKYPIYLELTSDKKVGEEGFKISADKNALRIAGKESVGILYGVYEVLKKDGGIRWLIPGEEGEYFKVKPTITVKEGIRIKNPDFARRNIIAVSMRWNSLTWETWDWGVRNNMRFLVSPGVVHTQKKYKNEILARAPILTAGGHVFSPYMVGKDNAKKLFAEHPEYFPLIRGKRVFTSHGGANPQPCTSNPDVIERVAQSVVRQHKSAEGGALVNFGNNDTTAWCRCENCLAQDPASETKAGVVSTRYWKFLNAVLKRAKEIDPAVKMQGWTYQNFSIPPAGVKPDLDLTALMLSNHRRCWKHALDDKNCPTNIWYYKYNKDWHDTGVKIFTYDMLSRAGTYHLPVERVWVNTLRWYKKNMPNMIGMTTERSCPDGIYQAKYNKVDIKHGWRQMWQSMYLAMYFHWDIAADYEKVAEEANSLYYGKGWEGGIKQYRALLEKLFMDASGCWGYGHSSPVGKFMDVPGAKEQLEKYLASAEKAAAKDPDKRALLHVKEAKFHYERTWLKNYNSYISNFREIKAYPLMGKIVLDGKLDEPDWKNVDTVTRFRNAFKDGYAKNQTAVKIAYDADNIYIGVECLEPEVNKLRNIITNHDGPVWDDNDLEFFINDPIMGSAYYQIAINSLGTVCDGLANPRFSKSLDTGTVAKISKGKDRYFMEVKIPAQSITGSKLIPGTVLKMNVMRCRRVEGKKSEDEYSTWSHGTPHSVDVFHAVTFTGPRQIAAGSRYEVDTRFWRNGSFNELAPANRKLPKHWKVKDNRTPKGFDFSSGRQYGGDMEMVLHPGSKENYFLRLRKGFLFQFHKVKNMKLKAAFRVKGKGEIVFKMLRYNSKYRNIGSATIKRVQVDSSDWKHMSFEFDRPSADMTEIHAFLFQPASGEVDLDDLYLVGR